MSKFSWRLWTMWSSGLVKTCFTKRKQTKLTSCFYNSQKWHWLNNYPCMKHKVKGRKENRHNMSYSYMLHSLAWQQHISPWTAWLQLLVLLFAPHECFSEYICCELNILKPHVEWCEEEYYDISEDHLNRWRSILPTSSDQREEEWGVGGKTGHALPA